MGRTTLAPMLVVVDCGGTRTGAVVVGNLVAPWGGKTLLMMTLSRLLAVVAVLLALGATVVMVCGCLAIFDTVISSGIEILAVGGGSFG